LSEEDKKRGLYGKYQVSRVDGKDLQGAKHYGCKLFILDYTDDPFARPALAEYAQAAKEEYPLLAKDLLDALKAVGYEHKSRGRIVVTPEMVKVRIVDMWPVLWPTRCTKQRALLCGHTLVKEMKRLQKDLISAIQDHDAAYRDTVMSAMASSCLEFFYRNKNSENAMIEVTGHMFHLMNRQGPRAFISSHEILGILVEEISELAEAVNEQPCQSDPVDSEAMDIALGAIFALISARVGGLEW
jgi:hypothetical protein